jgi:hypothetical protein
MKAKHYLRGSAALLVIAAAACNQDLGVENLSSPDIARVFATEASVEATIGAGYQTNHNAMTNQNLLPGVWMFGLEGFSGLNNFNMGTRVGIPRLPVSNQTGDPSVFSEYTALSKEARLVVNAIDALDVLIKGGKTSAPIAQDNRDRSFGFFVAGVSLGWLALVYDSAGIVSTGMKSDSIPPLSSSADVAKASLALLDSALAISNVAANAAGFPIPKAWLGQQSDVPVDGFRRIVRSYKARIRAGATRTPADAAKVDWAAVIADAENGITADYMVSVGGSTGWNIGDISQMYVDPGWMQMSMLYFGMADVSGSYAAYIAAPTYSAKNGNFEVITPDKRWPQGATRAAQNAVSLVQPTSKDSRPYISNRLATADVAGETWGISHYDYYRYKYIRNTSNTGLYPELMKAEIDLLAAEGYYRTGNLAAAAAKIDLTRVGNGGLPALTGVVTSTTQQVPGGLSSCVPQVPSGSTVSCGTLFEALKYEKRMEAAYSSFGRFWIDDRGWGDLVAGTALEFPVPYQEMQSRQKGSYNLGGGFGSSAPKGTYGF